MDIGLIMDSWTKQGNYPLVIVKRSGSNLFGFEQIRYFEKYGNKSSQTSREYSWRIPITYGSAKTVNWTNVDIVWMMNNKMNQTLNINSDDWYLVNVKQGGFYRVHYADNNWILLINQLQRNFTAIPVFSRAQILNDLFSLANILPDLRFITYCTAIRHGGQEEWKFLERQLILNDTVNENENGNKMLALTCSRDKEIMKRYFERIRENENLWFTLDYFAESPVGNHLLWDHLSDVNNFIKHKDFTESILNALTKYPYSLFSGRNYEKILVTEASNQIDPELQEQVKYLFEISSEKSKWIEVYSDIIQWLKENVPKFAYSL
ncbi:unnamed protein product [Schistosoma margrebowiei]|uniref:ERAP1-like C-terminal domain-containing protein n=1 Tax=Schistosoma margrebowiei TaxID=48269 RepID=A0A3P8HMI4_9TREM|nr:unnamed protein product [Schistosoma margrebowiei]